MIEAVLPVALLILLIGALVVLVKMIRGTTRGERGPAGPVWSLHELTRLRDSGEITVQQYDQLREQAIRKFKGSNRADNSTGNEKLRKKPAENL